MFLEHGIWEREHGSCSHSPTAKARITDWQVPAAGARGRRRGCGIGIRGRRGQRGSGGWWAAIGGGWWAAWPAAREPQWRMVASRAGAVARGGR